MAGQLLRTTFEYRETGDGWEAWEAGTDNEIVGRGETPAGAVGDYARKLEESEP